MEKGKNRKNQQLRGPFTGLCNIVRFNWHFYVIALLACGLSLAGAIAASGILGALLWVVTLGIALTTLISLVVSWYIYDRSNLYSFWWLSDAAEGTDEHILNIHAGFDETSMPIQQMFPKAKLQVYDFYNPKQHTEVSIRRAREWTVPYPGTVAISTTAFPAATDSFDRILIIFAAHEIRDDAERASFFREVARVARPGASIHVVEHLRDLPNFLAYTVGFLHFLSAKTWQNTFRAAGLRFDFAQRLNPFIVCYHLRNHANPD